MRGRKETSSACACVRACRRVRARVRVPMCVCARVCPQACDNVLFVGGLSHDGARRGVAVPRVDVASGRPGVVVEGTRLPAPLGVTPGILVRPLETDAADLVLPLHPRADVVPSASCEPQGHGKRCSQERAYLHAHTRTNTSAPCRSQLQPARVQRNYYNFALQPDAVWCAQGVTCTCIGCCRRCTHNMCGHYVVELS
jgi:hypothetical protein